MEDVYVDIRKENQWIRKYFLNKDFVTINELIGTIEDLDSEVEQLNEELEDLKQDIKENYEPKKFDPWQEYGLNPNDYH